MRILSVRAQGALRCGLAITAAPAVPAASTLFAGLGRHNNGDSINDGALATVDPATAKVTIAGHAAGISCISGLAFDAQVVFATTEPHGGDPPPPGESGGSWLLRLNPANGSIVTSVPVSQRAGRLDGHADVSRSLALNAGSPAAAAARGNSAKQ